MEVSQWMQGYGEDSDECMPFIATRGYDSVVWNRLYSRDPSNLNYRNRKVIFIIYHYNHKNYHCVHWFADQVGAIVEETLERAGAKAMVVGHTPQLEGVNWYMFTDCSWTWSNFSLHVVLIWMIFACSKYNNSIWRIDVGMSRGVLNSSPEVEYFDLHVLQPWILWFCFVTLWGFGSRFWKFITMKQEQ